MSEYDAFVSKFILIAYNTVNSKYFNILLHWRTHAVCDMLRKLNSVARGDQICLTKYSNAS